MPMDTAVQEVINSVQEGLLARALRGLLFAAVVGALFAAYTHRQFRGLSEPTAMEHAQLARSLADGHGFSTRCIRPVDAWRLEQHGRAVANPHQYPDVRHAPLYPALLAAGFRLARPSFAISPGQPFAPEQRVIVPLGIGLTILAGILLYVLGRLLFDPTVAFTSMLVFFVTDAVLAGSVAGTPAPLGLCLTTAAACAAAWAAVLRAAGRGVLRWLPPLLLSAVLAGLAGLTQYTLLVVPVALALYVAVAGDDRRPWLGILYLLAAALVVAPWLWRNIQVSGLPFGTAPYACLNDSLLYAHNAFDADPAPVLRNTLVARALRYKLLGNLGGLVDTDLRTLGSGLVICFFLVSFFRKLESAQSHALRWCVALGLAGVLIAAALAGAGPRLALHAFLPVVALYGTACFYLTATSVELFNIGWYTVMVWGYVALAALAAAARLAGAPAHPPYPPYYPALAAYATASLDGNESLATDIPWATAWYGNHTSILLPPHPDALGKLDGHPVKVGALYLTTETSLRAGKEPAYAGWRDVLDLTRTTNTGFRFVHGVALPPGTRDQLLLSDRPRWGAAETPASGGTNAPAPAAAAAP